MIRLERLQVRGFKRLTDIDLAFPPRCRVLIEGPNEAGKSTLFESIYFALYGDALVKRGGGRGRISSAIRHGLSRAVVVLTVSIGNTQLNIKRDIFRNRNNRARLEVTYPEREPETVSGVRAVNDRIVQEFHGLDGDALLNSCFVEQKRLDRLEDSTRAQREEVLLKLLDMDRLTELYNAFKWGRGDDRDLDTARDKLRLIRAAGSLEEAQKRQKEVDYKLKLVAVHNAFDEIDRQQKVIDRQTTERKRQSDRVERLDEQLNRVKHLKSAKGALLKIQDCAGNIHNYRTDLRSLQEDLDGIDRLEREELPAKREELGTLKELQTELQAIEKRERALQRIKTEWEELKDIVSLAEEIREAKEIRNKLIEQEVAASTEAEKAENRLKAAQTVEALQQWISAHWAEKSIADADRHIKEAEKHMTDVTERRDVLSSQKTRADRIVWVGIALFVLGVLSLELDSDIRSRGPLPQSF